MEEIQTQVILVLKVADGQTISAGTIILKQRGTKFHPGIKCKKSK